MTKPVTKLYTFYWNDGSYLSYMLTKAEFDKITEAIATEMPVVVVDVGMFVPKDIRSIILHKEVKEPEPIKGANPDMTQEELDWIKATELAERIAREESNDEDIDYEYVGGMV